MSLSPYDYAMFLFSLLGSRLLWLPAFAVLAPILGLELLSARRARPFSQIAKLMIAPPLTMIIMEVVQGLQTDHNYQYWFWQIKLGSPVISAGFLIWIRWLDHQERTKPPTVMPRWQRVLCAVGAFSFITPLSWEFGWLCWPAVPMVVALLVLRITRPKPGPRTFAFLGRPTDRISIHLPITNDGNCSNCGSPMQYEAGHPYCRGCRRALQDIGY